VKFKAGDRVYFWSEIYTGQTWEGFGVITRLDHDGYYVDTDVPCPCDVPGWKGDSEIYLYDEDHGNNDILVLEAIYNSPLTKALSEN
jgi:hypothetical protein